MKKLTLLTACLLFVIAFGAEAQNSYSGLRGGFNYSNVTGDDSVDDAEGKAGYHFGIFHHFGITENLGFQPEVLYSRKGYEVENDAFRVNPTTLAVTPGKLKRNFNLTYIDVPLLFVFTLGGNYGLQLLAGPSVGYIIGAKVKNETTFDGSTTESEIDGTDKLKINTLQVGVTGGLGYLTEGGFGIQGRVDYGVSKIFDNDDIDIKNLTYMLSLSWALGN